MFNKSEKIKAEARSTSSHDNMNYQSGDNATFQLMDNRAEMVAQRQLQETIHDGTEEPIQRMGVGAIDKKHLWKKLRAEGNVRDFESVNLNTCTGAEYNNEAIGGLRGITFPYQSPPLIYIDLSNIPNNDVLAATIYHETTHAYDKETPGEADNSSEAKAQDMTNEVSTWKKEIEYSIRTGGADLQEKVDDGFVIEKDGMMIPNPAKFTPDALRAMGYDEYDTEDRQDRFNPANYTFTAAQVLKPFGTAEEKHEYESEIQKDKMAETHGELGPMSDDVSGMYG